MTCPTPFETRSKHFFQDESTMMVLPWRCHHRWGHRIVMFAVLTTFLVVRFYHSVALLPTAKVESVSIKNNKNYAPTQTRTSPVDKSWWWWRPWRWVSSLNKHKTTSRPLPRCAIDFYGLPRAFESVVLPSVVQNIIVPNTQYGCDYYVHYYEQSKEPSGRSGSGGTIYPHEILLLREQVELAAQQHNLVRIPTVHFTRDTEQDFWEQYDELLTKIRNTRDGTITTNTTTNTNTNGTTTGNLFYFPWKDKSYQQFVTTDNIIKMWHSIQASWTLMSDHAQRNHFEYGRVAMLRSDVLYVTPINIFDKGNANGTLDLDVDNRFAVIPAFGRYPVSDRLIYGPARAVKVWAAERFQRMERHVQWINATNPGFGLHSERFVQHALLGAIRREQEQLQNEGDGDIIEHKIQIVEHPTLCMFRVRADETVWTSDCGLGAAGTIQLNLIKLGFDNNTNTTSNRNIVERILGRTCGKVTTRRLAQSLDCSKNQQDEQPPPPPPRPPHQNTTHNTTNQTTR